MAIFREAPRAVAVGKAGGFDLASLAKQHRKFLKEHKAMIDRSLSKAGEDAAEHVKRHHTFRRHKSSGSLADSTKHRVIRSRGGKILRLKWHKKYAKPIEHGSRPHVIRARRKKVLRFWSARAGKYVFAKKVRHPGNRPYHFGKRAQKHAYTKLGKTLRRGMQTIASKN